MLSNKEKEIYSRQIMLENIGEQGQEKLKASEVLVIGAGGLGCPVLQYLTSAGVGTIGIADFDKVDVSNLPRQVLYTLDDVGQKKTDAARKKLQQLNSHIQINTYDEKINNQNFLSIAANYDVIADCTDDAAMRYLIDDACVILNKTWVYASIFKFEAQIAVFNYKGSATYRCLFPNAPQNSEIKTCSDTGVMNILPGIAGCIQANEILKIILQTGDVLANKILHFNILKSNYNTFQFEKNSERIQYNEKQFKNMNYDMLCNMPTQEKIKEITADELRKITDNIQMIDVREAHEIPKMPFKNVLNIPIGELSMRHHEIDREKDVVIFCQHGIRSISAIQRLSRMYDFENLINLKGGIVTLKIPSL